MFTNEASPSPLSDPLSETRGSCNSFLPAPAVLPAVPPTPAATPALASLSSESEPMTLILGFLLRTVPLGGDLSAVAGDGKLLQLLSPPSLLLSLTDTRRCLRGRRFPPTTGLLSPPFELEL